MINTLGDDLCILQFCFSWPTLAPVRVIFVAPMARRRRISCDTELVLFTNRHWRLYGLLLESDSSHSRATYPDLQYAPDRP